MKVSKPFTISSGSNNITATLTIEGQIDEAVAADVAYRALGVLAHSAGHAFDEVQHRVIRSNFDGTGAAQTTRSTTINDITVFIKAEGTLDGIESHRVADVIDGIAGDVVANAIADATTPQPKSLKDLISAAADGNFVDFLAANPDTVKFVTPDELIDLIGREGGEGKSPLGPLDHLRFFSGANLDQMVGSPLRSSFHPMGGSSQDTPNRR